MNNLIQVILTQQFEKTDHSNIDIDATTGICFFYKLELLVEIIKPKMVLKEYRFANRVGCPASKD